VSKGLSLGLYGSVSNTIRISRRQGIGKEEIEKELRTMGCRLIAPKIREPGETDFIDRLLLEWRNDERVEDNERHRRTVETGKGSIGMGWDMG
jgi:hypothetical protein